MSEGIAWSAERKKGCAGSPSQRRKPFTGPSVGSSMIDQMIEVSAIETVIGSRNEARKISMKRVGRRTSSARPSAQRIWNGLMTRLKSSVVRITPQKAGSSNSSA